MGRSIRFSFMSLVYLFLYLPIIVLIANSFNETSLVSNGAVLPPSGTTL